MKKLLVAAIFVALSGTAAAGSPHYGYQNATASQLSSNNNFNASESVSISQGGSGGRGGQGGVGYGGYSDQGQGQDQGQQQMNRDLVNFDDHSVKNSTYKGADIPVSSAHAGPLVTSNNTCMGSTAAGVQAKLFGFSVGSTWQDEDCVRRLDAAFMAKMGDVNPARELMCQKPNIAQAYKDAGRPCSYKQTTVVATTPPKKNYLFLDDMGK